MCRIGTYVSTQYLAQEEMSGIGRCSIIEVGHSLDLINHENQASAERGPHVFVQVKYSGSVPVLRLLHLIMSFPRLLSAP